MKNPDAIVIGAGVVGAACALELAQAGLQVIVLDRGAIASGTTGAGEGNILVSDKEVGPELVLALRSRDKWFEISEALGGSFELEAKGGMVVAKTSSGLAELDKLVGRQRVSGVIAQNLDGRDLHDLEPYLAPEFESGTLYPQDAQCQPMMATAQMLKEARSLGARIEVGAQVIAIGSDSQGVASVSTEKETFHSRVVINATGTWAGEIAVLAGSHLPISPRRGFILVTHPAPNIVRHKVYDADYVANVASGAADLQSSAVVESTRSGTILVGASRERVEFDSTLNVNILRVLATQAIALFPVLAKVQLLRAYHGFRPYAPDHLPVIGEDAHVKGLWHSAGHEGAGIGLAPASAEIIVAQILGKNPFMDASAFSPQRFAVAR
ncbi:MAG: FAD-binding oxidoreductase [Actinobacteria bacterium]|nr:FAD-binding oxidoreductase [Actinomycetota bacterium]